MRPVILMAAASLVAASAATASAGRHVLSLTITNNTADAWGEVIFDIRPPVGVQFNPADYALVQFSQVLSDHNTSKLPVMVSLPQEHGQSLSFDFMGDPRGTAMTQDDGPVLFTVVIDNPTDMTFRVGYRKTIVPAPASAGMLGAAMFIAARRRRQS